MSWPDGGPWIVATTSTKANWTLATAVLCAASTVRVAVLRILAPDEERAAADAPYADLATYVEVRGGGVDPIRVDDLGALVRSLARTHGLVLVGAAPGLLVPLGPGGWTLADLAWTLGAPVVVVADSGTDSTNHATLVLDALANRDLSAIAIAIGEGNDFDALPIALAGRIPTEAAGQPELVRAHAARWLHPLLHAGADGRTTQGDAGTTPQGNGGGPSDGSGVHDPDGGTGSAPTETSSSDATPAETSSSDATPAGGPGTRLVLPGHPASGSGPAPASRTVSGRRVLAALLAVFVVMVLTVCGLAMWRGAGGFEADEALIEIDVRATPLGLPRSTLSVPVAPAVPVPVPATRPSASTVCPQYAGKVVPTVPDRRTTARIDAAWLRIERWLAEHAPRARASLRPPAPTKRIAALQERMSVAFPADLVASLRRHDGATPTDGFTFPPFYRPLPLDEIVTDWEVSCSVLAGVPVEDNWWHRDFVPFGTAGDGGCLLVDQRSGGHGRVGEFYPEEGTGFEEWPASVVDLLEGVARSLESGEPYLGRYRPVGTANGVLDWTIERTSPSPTAR